MAAKDIHDTATIFEINGMPKNAPKNFLDIRHMLIVIIRETISLWALKTNS